MDREALIRSLIVATTIFSAAIVLGIIAPLDALLGIGQLGDLLQPLEVVNPFYFLLLIFINNAVKALGVIGLGILLGLPAVLFVGANGFVLRAVVSRLKSVQGLEYAVASIAPHGVVEIPMLLLATALSLVVGLQSIKWLRRKESLVKAQLLARLKLYLKIVLPGLGIAAVIEIFVTPWLANLVGGGQSGFCELSSA